jgi:hypothetical protein
MNNDFTFINWTICDDVRTESNGKQLIIGAYAGVIMFQQIPFIVPALFLRIVIEPKRLAYKKIACQVLRPDKSEFFKQEFEWKVNYIQYPATLVFHQYGPAFNHTGDYEIHLSMDGPFYHIGSFKIITLADLPPVAPALVP